MIDRPVTPGLGMSLMLCYICDMARGPSGRVIVEMEPSVKRALHARLVSEGRSLKEWFLECAEAYLYPPQQSLPLETGEQPAQGYAGAAGKGRKTTHKEKARRHE